MARATAFYAGVMGWETRKMDGMDYTLLRISPAGPAGEAGEVAGGIMPRRNGEHKGIMPYFGVESVDERAGRVTGAGGKILMQKTAVPGYGYFVICRDTEKNTFAMWEEDKTAGEDGSDE